MSSTTRSNSVLGEPRERLVAVACLDDPVAVPLERVREEGLDRVLVVDEEDGRRRVRHRDHARIGARARLPAPTIAPCMEPARTARHRRRPRRGSVDRPIDTRLAPQRRSAASPARSRSSSSRSRGPDRCPRPALPPSFDGQHRARADARAHARPPRPRARAHPTPTGRRGGSRRSCGSTGSASRRTSGRPTSRDSARSSSATSSAVVRGTLEDTIVVVAHRDNRAGSSGANDNASGTAALVELARAYATVGTGGAQPRTTAPHDRASSRPTPAPTAIWGRRGSHARTRRRSRGRDARARRPRRARDARTSSSPGSSTGLRRPPSSAR